MKRRYIVNYLRETVYSVTEILSLFLEWNVILFLLLSTYMEWKK